MACSFKLIVFTAVLFLFPHLGHAQQSDQEFLAGIVAPMELLKKEIARDEGIISVSMTIIHLRQTRAILRDDLPGKEKVLAKLKEGRYSAIESVIRTLEETYEAEKQIADDIRINDAVQIRAMRYFRGALPKKRQALAEIEAQF